MLPVGPSESYSDDELTSIGNLFYAMIGTTRLDMTYARTHTPAITDAEILTWEKRR